MNTKAVKATAGVSQKTQFAITISGQRLTLQVTHSFVFLVFAALLIFLSTNRLGATGSKVSIVLRSGQEIAGELLIVTDSLLVISRSVGLSLDKLVSDSVGISTIRREDIKILTICGKSYLTDGLLLGGIFGIGVGTLLSYEPTGSEAYGSNFDPFGAGAGAIFIGLAGGLAIGAFVGIEATTSDEVMELEGKKHIFYLAEYSRYYERSVPEFMIRYLIPKSTVDITPNLSPDR